VSVVTSNLMLVYMDPFFHANAFRAFLRSCLRFLSQHASHPCP